MVLTFPYFVEGSGMETWLRLATDGSREFWTTANVSLGQRSFGQPIGLVELSYPGIASIPVGADDVNIPCRKSADLRAQPQRSPDIECWRRRRCLEAEEIRALECYTTMGESRSEDRSASLED